MTQRYLLAHRLLPGLMESDPAGFQAALLKGGRELLQRLWAHAGQHVEPGSEGELSFSHHQLTARHEALLITLPAPEQPPEAYFIAMMRGPGEEARIYTLEMGVDHSFLCGWSGATHSNLGEGPAPDREAFLKRLAELA